MGVKEKVSWTIDSDLIKLLKKQSKKEERSISFLVNRYLKDIFRG